MNELLRHCVRWMLVGVFAFIQIGIAAGAQDDEQRLIQGLRERRLFGLARRFCQQQLARGNLSKKELADYTVELIRCIAEQALHAKPQQRGDLWRQAQATAGEFVRLHPSHPRRLSVEFQNGLTLLARGELNRHEFEVSSRSMDRRDTARQNIRTAIGELESLNDKMERLPQPARRQAEPDGYTPDEQYNLRQNVRLQLARAYRNQALCFDSQSDDRIAALTKARSQLDDLLKQLAAEDPLRWSAQLEKIICERLLGNLASAVRLLAALVAEKPAPPIRLQAQAEAIRIELAAGRHLQVEAIAQQGRTLQGKVSPELDLGRLEAYLALWRRAENDRSREVEKWQREALQAVKQIELDHGPYWTRRAEMMLGARASSGSGSSNAEILARTADNLYRQGQHEQAISAYDQAARRSREQGDSARAFSLYYKAALVEQQRGEHQSAWLRFRQLAKDLAPQPRSPDAHLMAAWNLSRTVKKVPRAAADYEQMLIEHTNLWPNHSSTQAARYWLGRVFQSRRAWGEAAKWFLQVAADAKEFPAALKSAAECAPRAVQQLDADKPAQMKLAEKYADQFEKIAQPTHPKDDQPWTPTRRFALLIAERLRIQFTSGHRQKVIQLLKTALEGSPPPEAGWKSSAQALLVVALAESTAHRGEAQKVLSQLAGSDPQELLEMITGLASAAESATVSAKKSIAQLQLHAIQNLSPAKNRLPSAEKKRLGMIHGQALSVLNQRQEAQRVLSTLANEHKNDAQVQEAFAEFLLSASEMEKLRAAVAQWRQIATRSKPRTPRWYRAKYSTALALFRLGEKRQAAQVIRYVRATPPGLSRTSLKEDFLNLLAQCGD